MPSEQLSCKILGQINLMQSMVTMLPDIDSMMEFTCRGLCEVPGVESAQYTLNTDSTKESCDTQRYLRVQYANTVFADIILTIGNRAQLELYIPFLENLATMLGVICDERRQKEENIALYNDLKERVLRRTHELHEREEDLLITLNSIGDGVITTDLDGNITRLNPTSEKLTGWSLSEAIGKPLSLIFQIVSAKTGETIENPVATVLETGNTVGLANHTILISRDQTRYHIADSAAPIQDFHGNIRGVVLVFHNVTEEYKLQEELQQAHKMEAIGKLAGGIAHDFNNVLSGIIGAADLLRSLELNNSQAQTYANIIINTAQRAADLTHKLSSFSRKRNLTPQILDLHTLLNETETLLARSIDKKVAIKLDLKAQQYYIKGNASLLQNSILNIGINASHAMPQGGTFSITTTGEKPPKQLLDSHKEKTCTYIHITCSDTGCGIAPSNLKKIFEPFFTTKKRGEGTGWGLSTTYKTIQEHNGVITVESQEKKGTTFHIYLPLAANPQVTQESQAAKIKKGKGTILAIDDEDAVRLILDAILTQLGYTVLLASSGSEAVELFRNNKESIDLVILDMIMPKMNGTETFTKLRELSAEVKVLICSGFCNDGEIAKLKKQGIIGFIRKPFTIEQISAVIAKHI